MRKRHVDYESEMDGEKTGLTSLELSLNLSTGLSLHYSARSSIFVIYIPNFGIFCRFFHSNHSLNQNPTHFLI